MSQPVGLNYKTRIPQFSDDASIEEALKVYHYGVDNYTSQPIPDDSIEGNFRTLNTRVDAAESSIAALGTTYVEQVSASATPNVVTPQTATTIPLTLRGAASQTGNLQQWQNNSSTNLAVVFSDGSSSFNGYIAIGTTGKSSTTAADIRIINSSHKGVTVRSATGQTANIQEWQNSGGTAIAWVDKDGTMYSRGDQVATDINQGIGSFFLMGG
jgi:hypothetical protein